MNPILVNKEPGTGSLFPICTFESFSIIYQNKELVSRSRFPIPCFRFYSFEISETFLLIRNKEPVAGSRFPVPDYQFYINICSFHTYLTVFIICRQITFYSLVSFNALHADEIDITRN